MAKKVKSSTIKNRLYNVLNRKVFKVKAKSLLPSKVIKIVYEPDNPGAYTRAISGFPDNFKIMLGGGMVSDVAALPEFFKKASDARMYLPSMNMVFRGLFYHEVGHLIFTDMHDDSIINYPKPEYRGFIHQLFNILEDVTMERYGMSTSYPYTAKYFKYLTVKVFLPNCSKYVDSGDSQSFLNYILLRLRCGKKMTAVNAAYDKNRSYLNTEIKKILFEPIGKERIKKSIILAEWIIDNYPEIDFKFLPESEDAPVTSKTGPGGGSSGGATIDTPLKSDEDKPDLLKKDELPDADLEDAKESDYNADDDIPLGSLPEVDESFNDVLKSGEDRFELIVCRDYFEPVNGINKILQDKISKYNNISLDISKSIKLFKSRNKPRYKSGYNSGKLNMHKAMVNTLTHGCDVNLFKRKKKLGEIPDIAISIMCDNSGSMYGNKSRICCDACLALAKACEYSDVPLEVNAFTEGCGICYTLVIKDFNESLDESLPYFGILDDEYIDGSNYNYDHSIPVFCGNIDEVNMYYLAESFKRNIHKNKILIVISDGETCGSTETLRNIISDMEKNGIKVIGLGVQSRAVEAIYPNRYIFDSLKALEELPKFLTNLLETLSKGGK